MSSFVCKRCEKIDSIPFVKDGAKYCDSCYNTLYKPKSSLEERQVIALEKIVELLELIAAPDGSLRVYTRSDEESSRRPIDV